MSEYETIRDAILASKDPMLERMTRRMAEAAARVAVEALAAARAQAEED